MPLKTRVIYHQQRWERIKKETPWYKHYRNARQRCTNSSNSHYHRYGGRGIKFLLSLEEIKKLWFRDEAWLLKEPSIDRKDNNGNYEFSNCRFIEWRKNLKEKLPIFYCKICNKVISKTSGKYGQKRCGSCAKSIDQKGRKK